jgi:LuxR family transcriptional regulator, maltose regulon positive regulatory protein
VTVRGPAQFEASVAGRARLPDERYLVTRQRLLSRLELAARERLTLLVAPSGSGKTVLLAEWVVRRRPPRARWITGEGLVQPDGFVRALLSALSPGGVSGDDHRVGVDVPESPELVRRLVDEALEKLADQPPTTLIIDELQHVTDPVALGAVRQLIDHGPRSLRLVLATQVDLPLLFYRRHLDNEVLELRQGDLLFQRDEAEELLRRAAGRDLTPSQISQVWKRTEGWAMGLWLAAVALRDVPDPAPLIDEFASSDRLVADYLTTEVVQRQPEQVQRFLLTTSVLERLCPNLCDRLLERSDSQWMLTELQRTSMFVTRLPAEPGWWRYHQLFRSLLRHRLHAHDPEGEQRSLERAAEWHLEHHEDAAAMHYFAEATAWDRIMDHTFEAAGGWLLRGEVAAVGRSLGQVPSEVRRTRPTIMLLGAAASILTGGPRPPEPEIDDLQGLPQNTVLVADVVRAYGALRRGDPVTATRAATRVLDELDAGVALRLPNLFGLTGSPSDLMAAAHLVRGAVALFGDELSIAEAELVAATDDGSAVWHVEALGYRALLEVWRGRLRAAENRARRAIELARQLGPGLVVKTVQAQLALAQVARARGQLDEAGSLLEDLAHLIDERGDPVTHHLLVTERARLLAETDPPEFGLHFLAVRQHQQPPPDAAFGLVRAQRQAAEARLLLYCGDLDGAERVLGPPPDLVPDLATLRIAIALERGDDVAAGRVVADWAMQPDPRTGWERDLWAAVLLLRQGDERAACDRFDRVVDEARLHEHLGVFLDAGHHVQPAARALFRSRPSTFLRAITQLPSRPATRPNGGGGLVEPLTEREQALLALLPGRSSNAEIASVCGVSVNTVKTHLKHIYQKLGVTKRREAVAVAERLRLL